MGASRTHWQEHHSDQDLDFQDLFLCHLSQLLQSTVPLHLQQDADHKLTATDQHPALLHPTCLLGLSLILSRSHVLILSQSLIQNRFTRYSKISNKNNWSKKKKKKKKKKKS